MCGIFAAISSSINISSKKLLEINSLMEHRGPDSGGIYLDSNVAMGVRRLRVHDNSHKSDQPFISNCKNYILAFNGAIYNYRVLKADLINKGITFNTNSDTEVLLQGLINEGVSFIDRLDGMFAGIFYDIKNKKITAFRDPVGIKPLYTYEKNGVIIFSSEIKPILKYPGVKKELNVNVLPEYFAFHYLQPPDTFFKDINVFMPGTVNEVNIQKDSFGTQTRTYWEINSETLITGNDLSVENILIKNIENCWNNDRKTGIQLSGGIDSSLVCSYSKEILNIEDIYTYSVIFNDSEIKYYKPRSEEKYIDIVADKYSLNSNKYLFTPQEIREALPKSIYYMESPIVGASTSLYYLLAQKTKKDVTVLLTGEGADDLFLGYWNNLSFDEMNIEKNIIPFVPIDIVSSLFDKRNYQHPLEKKIDYLNSNKLNGMTIGQKISACTITSYLHGLLARHDRMFMAGGIEGRPPFISKELIEKRFSLKQSDLHDGINGKLNLKKLAEKYYNKDFIYRPKIGFSSPYGDWSSDSRYWKKYWSLINKDMLGEILNISVLEKYLNMEDSIEKWSGANLNFLFVLLNFQIWYEIYFESSLDHVLNNVREI